MAATLGRELDDCLAAGVLRAAQPLRGGLRSLEITIADAGAGARHRRTGERLHDCFRVFQGTRSAHHGAILVGRQELRREVLHVAPERLLVLALECLGIGEVGEFALVALHGGRVAGGAQGHEPRGVAQRAGGIRVDQVDRRRL